MKRLKKYKILIFLIACFILGFLMGPLFHSGYIPTYLSSFKIRWYLHLLFFLGSLFLTLALHELTHLISFLFSGYKSDVIIILFFVFYRKDNKWKLLINFKLLLLGGGLVMPNLGEINNEQDYLKAKKAVSSSLLAAPLFTFISGLLLFVITLIFFYSNGIMVTLSFYILLFSLFYTYLSSKESGQMYGDFKAYKKVNNDKLFSKLIVLQYVNNLTSYLKEIISNHLEKQLPINNDITSLSFFQALLDESIYELNEIDLMLYEKVYYYVKNPYHFRSLTRNPIYFNICQSIIFYLDKLGFYTDSRKLAKVYIDNIDKQKINDKVKVYISKQTNHILKNSDESEYINNPKNMYNSVTSFIFVGLPFYTESELSKNKGYQLFDLTCNI